MGVAELVGWGGVIAILGVSEGSADGDAVTDAVAAGSGGPQAAESKVSNVIRKTSFFIIWILAQIKKPACIGWLSDISTKVIQVAGIRV